MLTWISTESNKIWQTEQLIPDLSAASGKAVEID